MEFVDWIGENVAYIASFVLLVLYSMKRSVRLVDAVFSKITGKDHTTDLTKLNDRIKRVEDFEEWISEVEIAHIKSKLQNTLLDDDIKAEYQALLDKFNEIKNLKNRE